MIDHKKDPQKAIILVERKNKSEEITVLFNPEQYSISKSSQYASVAIPGTESPIIQYIRGEAETLSLNLFFDTYTYYNGEDVRLEHTQKITDLLKKDPDLHAPPPCSFKWGGLIFTGILEKADTTFTMFDHKGIPVRATMAVTFKQLPGKGTSTENSSETKVPESSPDRTKIRQVKEGDSLWLFAFREYGDPSKWKIIAEKNNISNPRNIKPGTQIIIPPLS